MPTQTAQPDVKPVTDPKGMANWLAAGMTGNQAAGQDVGLGLSQAVSLGTGQKKKGSLFGAAT
jgi:hypothetical protein